MGCAAGTPLAPGNVLQVVCTFSLSMPKDSAPPIAETVPGVVGGLTATWRDLRGLAGDHLELAALEAQRAAAALVRVIVITAVAAILLAAAWIAAVIGLALWATGLGLSPAAACWVAAAANIAVAAALLFWLRGRVPELLFAGTLRQLGRTFGSEEPDEHGSTGRSDG